MGSCGSRTQVFGLTRYNTVWVNKSCGGQRVTLQISQHSLVKTSNLSQLTKVYRRCQTNAHREAKAYTVTKPSIPPKSHADKHHTVIFCPVDNKCNPQTQNPLKLYPKPKSEGNCHPGHTAGPILPNSLCKHEPDFKDGRHVFASSSYGKIKLKCHKWGATILSFARGVEPGIEFPLIQPIANQSQLSIMKCHTVTN